ncbi:hypothetical protein FB451DRAFT_1205932 [Mycena latifolia]|nr:hypothetical protein FB451DRAFT_1205932 [Mycena latifolia]
MHIFSIPALLVALVASFSPAVLFSIVNPVPGLRNQGSSFGLHATLDALEESIDYRRQFFDTSAFQQASGLSSLLHTPVLDASSYLDTAFDPGYKSSCMHHSVVTCALSSAAYPAWSLLLLPALVLVLSALHVYGPAVPDHLRPYFLAVRRAVRRRVLLAVLNTTVIALSLCRLALAVDDAIGRAFVRALLSIAVLARWLWWPIQRATVLAVGNWPVMADRVQWIVLPVKRVVVFAVCNGTLMAERLWRLVLTLKRAAVLAVGNVSVVGATFCQVILRIKRAVIHAPIWAGNLWKTVLTADRALERAATLAPIYAERLWWRVLAIGEVSKRTAAVDDRTAEESEAECIATCICRPPTAYRPSRRLRPCSAPGHLVLVPAAPTPAGAAVWRIVCLPPPVMPVAPVPTQCPCVRVHRPDRSRAVTDTPTSDRKSDRVRTHSAPGLLALDPAVSTPAGPAVIPVAPPTPLPSHVASAESKLAASPRICRPDRARVVTDTPEKPVRASARERRPSAPGQLLLVTVAPTPAGAAVKRVIPLSPLRTRVRASQISSSLLAPAAITSAARTQYTPAAPRDDIIYQTATRHIPSSIFSSTPGAPAPDIIYSTGPAPPVAHRVYPRSPQSPRPSRASRILYHGRSGPPAFQQTPVSASALAPYVSYNIARVEAEADRREALLHYRAQHCPGALAQLVRAATQGRPPGAR